MYKIIDAHVHFGTGKYSPFLSEQAKESVFRMKNEAEQFIKIMDDNNVDKSIAFAVPHMRIDVDNSNNYIYEEYLKYPDRIIPFCRLNKNLEENLNKGFKGAKLHLLYEQLNISDLKKYFQILEAYNCSLILHALFKNKPEQVKQILEYAPKIKLILAHMGRNELYTMNGILEVVSKLSSFNNVYFETSTIGEKTAVEKAIAIVGEDRIIYGSDYPYGKIYYEDQKQDYSYNRDLAIVGDAEISEQAKVKIFRQNIQRLL
ncbi:MAG: amidohydrolase family protein [Bacilli bacterium]|nr:amidohydrolase family protein [Bacilli bacterium]MDD3304714.1 amidohydrolase family protein [Bacilli bacterium]MDD4053607.1 amidohydrolase family protein [Bacilli bacterium]MDD4411106.1 amidohydrolase family protein [Bacilli bacterium]